MLEGGDGLGVVSALLIAAVATVVAVRWRVDARLAVSEKFGRDLANQG